MTAPDPNKRKQHVAQVGGTHYEAADGVQHWDIIEQADIAYLEATATKYIVRWDRKGSPAQDLEKAASYLARLLQGRSSVRRTVGVLAFSAFVQANDLSSWKAHVLQLILVQGREHHLLEAIRLLGEAVQQIKRDAAQ